MTEIYILITQSRALGMLRWGGEISNTKKRSFIPNSKERLFPKSLLSPLAVTFWDATGGWRLCLPGVGVQVLGHPADEILPNLWEGISWVPVGTKPISYWWLWKRSRASEKQLLPGRLANTTGLSSELPLWKTVGESVQRDTARREGNISPAAVVSLG